MWYEDDYIIELGNELDADALEQQLSSDSQQFSNQMLDQEINPENEKLSTLNLEYQSIIEKELKESNYEAKVVTETREMTWYEKAYYKMSDTIQDTGSAIAGAMSGGTGGGDGGDGGDDDDDEISKLVQDAINGGKDHKDYVKKLTDSDKSLKKSINSYDKQIAKHQDKIKNPEKQYHTDNPNANPPQRKWEGMPEGYKERVLRSWNEEINGFKVQRGIAKEILRQRGDL